jgi:GDPmannose 4,6-dehydratase
VAFSHVGLDYRDFVIEDTENLRLEETGLLVGDPAKAHRVLGWKAAVPFQDIVKMMVEADLKAIHKQRELAAEAVSASNLSRNGKDENAS